MSILWWICGLVALDQASKYVVVRAMALGQSVPVWGDFFRLTYIHNPGAAFGLDLGSPLLHLVVSLAALGALALMYRSTPPSHRLTRWALVLVLGGALGNIVDRVRLQQVIDFLDFGVGGWRWPVFNLADSFVTVGALLLALTYVRPGAPQQEPADAASRGTPEERLAQS